MALIQLKNVSISRGDREVVQNFSAELQPGMITAIIGPNGSGKSSLIAALAGDLPIKNGTIEVDGRSLSEFSVSEQAAMRSVVQQVRNYWLSYTAREVIEMGQPESALARVESVMKALHISDYANQKVTTLSGGEAQRIEIARALVRDCDIYLLDEPLSAQDSASKERIIGLLQQLKREGKTVVVVAHINRDSLSWCDKVIDTLAK